MCTCVYSLTLFMVAKIWNPHKSSSINRVHVYNEMLLYSLLCNDIGRTGHSSKRDNPVPEDQIVFFHLQLESLIRNLYFYVMCTCMCGYKKRPEELIRSINTGVVGGHKPSKMGGGSHTHVLRKSNKYL